MDLPCRSHPYLQDGVLQYCSNLLHIVATCFNNLLPHEVVMIFFINFTGPQSCCYSVDSLETRSNSQIPIAWTSQ